MANTPNFGFNLPASGAQGWGDLLNSNFSALDSHVQAVSGLAASLNNGLAGVSSRVDTVSGSVAGNSASLSALSSKVDTVSGSMSGINTNVAALSGSISNLDARVTALNAQVNNPSKGYYMGGLTGTGGTSVSSIDVLAFSGETKSALASTLNDVRGWGGTTQSTSKAYLMGGLIASSSSVLNSILGFTFSSETSAVLANTMNQARHRNIAALSSSSKGYTYGGNDGVGGSALNGNVITFATETVAAINGWTGVGTQGSAPIGNSTQGYVVGGYESGYLTTIRKMPYSTETWSSVGNISYGQCQAQGTSSSDNGYVVGGNNGAALNKIARVAFATDTPATLSAVLSVVRDLPGTTSSQGKGYIAGGTNGSAPNTSINALTYPTEAISTLGATLTAARYAIYGASH